MSGSFKRSEEPKHVPDGHLWLPHQRVNALDRFAEEIRTKLNAERDAARKRALESVTGSTKPVKPVKQASEYAGDDGWWDLVDWGEWDRDETYDDA